MSPCRRYPFDDGAFVALTMAHIYGGDLKEVQLPPSYLLSSDASNEMVDGGKAMSPLTLYMFFLAYGFWLTLFRFSVHDSPFSLLCVRRFILYCTMSPCGMFGA